MTNKQRREQILEDRLNNQISNVVNKMKNFDRCIEESIEYSYSVDKELGLVIKDEDGNLYEKK